MKIIYSYPSHWKSTCEMITICHSEGEVGTKSLFGKSHLFLLLHPKIMVILMHRPIISKANISNHLWQDQNTACKRCRHAELGSCNNAKRCLLVLPLVWVPQNIYSFLKTNANLHRWVEAKIGGPNEARPAFCPGSTSSKAWRGPIIEKLWGEGRDTQNAEERK